MSEPVVVRSVGGELGGLPLPVAEGPQLAGNGSEILVAHVPDEYNRFNW